MSALFRRTNLVYDLPRAAAGRPGLPTNGRRARSGGAWREAYEEDGSFRDIAQPKGRFRMVRIDYIGGRQYAGVLDNCKTTS